MLDLVSFETATTLKEAGFPQPQYIEFGFGYDETGSRFTIQECRFPPLGVDGMYFAPTATDILRELPGANLRWNGSTFFCKYRGETENQNPADALAQMWLRIFVNA